MHLPVVAADPSAAHEHAEDSTPAEARGHSHSSCGGCSGFDRREFLSRASLLGLGALVTAACGDGVIGGPDAASNLLTTPFVVDPKQVSSLLQVGGRAVVTSPSSGSVLVEHVSATVYRAFSLSCPHQGTTLTVQSNGFHCPNHDARFSPDGVWQSGQPTSDLVAVAVQLQADGTLLVGGVVAAPTPPVLALSATTISFTASTTGAAPAAQSVNVTNSGGGVLSDIGVALSYGTNQPTGWLTVALNATTAPAAIQLTAARGLLPAGTYTAALRVSATGASNAAQTVNVTLVVLDPNAPPALQLSASALSFSATRGATPTAQTVQLLNSGGGTLAGLAFTIAYGTGATAWLSTSLLSGSTAPATLTVRPETSALAAGTYTATITVTAAAGLSRTITISVTVVGAGLAVTIASWPALATVGGAVGSVGNLAGVPVAVVRTGASTFAAYSMRCPHQGTTVRVQNYNGTGSTFYCPSHTALWNSSGQLLSTSRQRTSALPSLTVTYTPGDTVLYVS